MAPFTASGLLEGEGADVELTGDFVLIPGDDRLSLLEKQPERHDAFATHFRRALKKWDRFDVCIVDTNPNPDIRYASALISADYLLAPVQLNQEALAGINALVGHPRYGFTRIKTILNPKLDFIGILPNLVEPTPFQRANMGDLIRKYASRLIADYRGASTVYSLIQKRSAIAESQASGLFLPDLKKTSGRETWREVKPVFDIILSRMGITTTAEVV